jgi:hypothetical protein
MRGSTPATVAVTCLTNQNPQHHRYSHSIPEVLACASLVIIKELLKEQ